MGILIDFYTGDTGRIVAAWNRGDLQAATVGSHVSAHADFSFHLSEDNLDQLVQCACAFREQAPFSFISALASDLSPPPAGSAECGLHEMSEAFTDLFAAIPAEQAAALDAAWAAAMAATSPAAPAQPSPLRRWWRKLRNALMSAVMAAVLLPLIAVMWLFSPAFRQDRKRNTMKLPAGQARPKLAPDYTTADAIAALIHTCQTAKRQGTPVIIAWAV